MAGRIRATAFVLTAAAVLLQPLAAGARTDASPAAQKTVASLTTRDVRVVVVATRVTGGAALAAEVRVRTALRVRGAWRESRETRLGRTYFWHTVSGPHAVCRIELGTTRSRVAYRPYVVVQLLQSPSLGCGPTHRIPLTT
jgi:hypothetical protein